MLHFTMQEKIQLVKVYPRILINMHLVTVLFRKKSNQKKKFENFPNSISKSLNGALLNRLWNTQGKSILIPLKHLFKTQTYVDVTVANKNKIENIETFCFIASFIVNDFWQHGNIYATYALFSLALFIH